MLSKYLHQTNLDANDASGPGASGGGASSPSQDANTTSISQDGEGASSTPSADANHKEEPAKSFDETAMETVMKLHPEIKADDEKDKTVPPAESSPAKTGTEEPVVPTVKTPSSTEDPSKTKPSDVIPPIPKPTSDEDFSSLPFHKHPDFQKLVHNRNELRDSIKQLEPALNRVREIDTIRQQKNITDEQFKFALDLVGTLNTDPSAAAKLLENVNAYVAKFQGTALPSDLQKLVEDGQVPLEVAQRVVKAENQKEFIQQQQQLSAKVHEQQQVQTETNQRISLLDSAVNSWKDNVKRLDPDYARKEKLVLNTFVALSATNPWNTPEAIVALAQRAYDEVNEQVGAFVPKPPVIKNLDSSTSLIAANNNEPVKWDDKSLEDRMVERYAHSRR